MKKLLPNSALFLWIWGAFLLSLWLSWQLLSALNFGYDYFHEYAGVKEHIQHYAPLNQYKPGFATTSPQTRAELFAGIVDAINHNGEGLSDLSYSYRGKTIQLFHRDEILHLKDVAQLINQADKASLLVFIIWLGISIWLIQRHIQISALWSSIYLLSGVLLLTLVVFIIGPQQVFDALHHMAFKSGAPWFFYYEESLMSTMLMAPMLFAYLSVLWLVTATLLCLTMIISINQLQKKARQRRA